METRKESAGAGSFFVPSYTMCVETLLYICELLFYNYNCKDYEFAVLPLPRLAYYLDF